MNYRVAIKDMLTGIGDYRTPEDIVAEKVRLAMRVSNINEVQFAAALEWLHERGYIDFEVDTFTEKRSWYLKEGK